MNYSSTHKHFANQLNSNHNINEQDVLDHPEDYLGPNYKEVLNLWFYRESWSKEQWVVYWDRYWELDNKTRDKARKTAKELASKVIGPIIFDVVCRFFEAETLELIATHHYIERGIPFTFLPLFFDL